MRKRIGWLTVICMCLIAVGVARWVVPRDPISEASVEVIDLGMTADKVAAILGRPADYQDSNPKGEFTLPGEMGHHWWGGNGAITVVFDGRGKVNFKHFQPAMRIGFFRRALIWLGW